MGEFAQLEEDLLPVFREVERIKQKYRITSLTLESYHTIEQFHGSHGGKRNFMGKREYRHRKNIEKHFIQIK